MIIRYGGKASVRQFYAFSSCIVAPIHVGLAGGDLFYADNPNLKSVWIRIFNKNGNLQMVLENRCDVKWEYNRKGGCGQADISLLSSDDSFGDSIQPEASVKIYIDRQLRYSGKLIRVSRSYSSGQERTNLVFYGYMIELNTLIVRASYTGMSIGGIVRDILTNYVTPYSNISYLEADIDDTDYAVEQVDFNHTIADAMSFLADMGGNIEWGVDRNKRFFFKNTDPNIRRVYVLGKDVLNYQEERQDDGIINTLKIFGGSDNSLLATISSELSILKYGVKTANLFESSIDNVSDASRLGAVKLANSTSLKRSSKFSILKSDEFIETAVPIGATTVNRSIIRIAKKYGHNAKYGRNIKYGKMRRDQISNISYQLTSGGFMIEATISGDVPNIGDLQKRIENEIKNLQR